MRLKALLVLLPVFTFALNVPPNFIEGFKIGKEFGKREVISYISDLKEVLKIQREIFEGKLPACYIDRFGELRLLKPIKLNYTSVLDSGYYAVLDLSNYPDFVKGYVVYILRVNNYTPDFDRNKVWVKFSSKADAEVFLNWVRKKFKIEGYIYQKD